MAKETDQDLITFIIFCALIFFGIKYFFSHYYHDLSRPIIYLSYGILKIFSVVTSSESLANQVVNKVGLTDLKNISEAKSSSIIWFAGYYVKYILIFYGFFLIVYLHTRPSKSKFKRLLSPQRLIEINVDYTPCLAPIVNRDPNDANYFEEWHPALSPFEFLINNRLVIDKGTGEVLGKSMLTETGFLIDYESDTERAFFLIDKEKTLTIVNHQLGERFTENNIPDYMKALVVAFHAFNEGKWEIGQEILDEVSFSFLNKKEMKQVEIKMRKTNKYLKKNDFPVINQPIHVFLASQFTRIDPPISTTQFIWLKAINRSLWYSLHQVGGETYWSESLAIGLALQMNTCNSTALVDSVVLSFEGCLIEADCFS